MTQCLRRRPRRTISFCSAEFLAGPPAADWSQSRAVVTRAHGHSTLDWAGVAADCGFHDQAHLIREFRAFSGLTPTEYLGRVGPYESHIAVDS